MRYTAIRKLCGDDPVHDFDCGTPELNHYLIRYAFTNQRSHMAQTYVVCHEGRVVGYYSLAVGSVQCTDLPQRIQRGIARHPVPVMLLARLAVDRHHQAAGLGKALLKDALVRTLQASDIAGIRALLIHAKDADAKRWYTQFDVEESPTDPYHLFLLLKDIRAAVQA